MCVKCSPFTLLWPMLYKVSDVNWLPMTNNASVLLNDGAEHTNHTHLICNKPVHNVYRCGMEKSKNKNSNSMTIFFLMNI